MVSLKLVLAPRHRYRGNEEEAEGIDYQGEISKNFEKLKNFENFVKFKKSKIHRTLKFITVLNIGELIGWTLRGSDDPVVHPLHTVLKWLL